MNRVHKTYADGAIPSGSPGCPEFAFCTASSESVRIVLMQSVSMSVVFTSFVAVVISLDRSVICTFPGAFSELLHRQIFAIYWLRTAFRGASEYLRFYLFCQ